VTDGPICFAGNAVLGRGGQGEFLRQMVFALNQLRGGRILSRSAQADRAECINLPFTGWRNACFRAIANTPILRRRRDLLTWIDDVDFDSRLSARVAGAGLLDAVMGQCSATFELLRKKNTPLVLTALNTHIDSLADLLSDEHRRLQMDLPSFIYPGMRVRVRREIECAGRIRAVSELVKRSFVERGVKPEKVEVLLPAVDLDYFRPIPKNDDVFRVLAVLTIDPRKGAYYLLQAFEKAAIPNSELVIIGATGDRWSSHMWGQFRARLPNIHMQSADVLREPIEATYGRASVLVHPAIEDGFGLAINQALACGKPVIATRQTGASQLITEGENGYVVESRDVDGLVDRLRFLAREPSLLQRLGAAASASVSALGYPSMARDVAQLYSGMLGTHV
jgi:glycosyltransferase involved in cell wall biosynthesis